MELAEFNALPAPEAAGVVAVWAAIPAWVGTLVARRPYDSIDDLAHAASEAATAWTNDDLDEALAHHPRIGERPTSTGAGAEASRREQASMTDAAADVAARIAAGNADYEERFGRVFLIRAAGRNPDEILTELERRLGNDDDTEASEALDQLAQIALLRLRATVTDDERTAGMTSHLTTHVLDSSTGAPAEGIAVVLAEASGGSVVAETPGSIIAHGTTDADGRAALGPALLPAGDYTLTFLTGAYFAAREVETFYPFVTVTFTVEVADDGSSRHYHVPLLLSPFAYSTYRGS